MGISLRQTLFQILLGSIIVTAVMILLSVWGSTSRLVDEHLERELEVTQRVFAKVVADREQLMQNVSNVLAKNYGFRQVLMNLDDIKTLNSALESHFNSIAADLLVILNAQGNVVTTFPNTYDIGHTLSNNRLLEQLRLNGRASGLMVGTQQLYQAILLPIQAPTPIADYVIAFAFDEVFLEELSNILQAEILIYESIDSTDVNRLLVSSLGTDTAEKLINSPKSHVSWFDSTLLNSKTYVTRPLYLPGLADTSVKLAMAIDVTKHLENFTQLQLRILGITIVAIIVSLVFAMYLARRVSEPVGKLVDAVEYIADGEYQHHLVPSGKVKEIVELANAFTCMQKRIETRERRITYQAEHDQLTGLFNRYYIESLTQRISSLGQSFQVICIKIIGFRTINDLYGYAIGDFCLKVIAKRMQYFTDSAARLSGGELLYIAQPRHTVAQLESIKQSLEKEIHAGLISLSLKVAIAEIHCPEDADSAEEIFRKINIVVDEAIHHENRLVRYQHAFEERYYRRLNIITELKKALQSDCGELSMVYQPKVDLTTMKVCSAEALIRWHNSKLGVVPPDEFISVAEQAGLIADVTLWVLQATLLDLYHFREAGLRFTVAINLSTQDIQNWPLLDKLFQICTQIGLSTSDVELEITESDLVRDHGEAASNLTWLRAQGFKLAIDDFGTGYSSLAYLKNLPVDTIKIDKSFILSLSSEANDQQIVHTVLSLAKVFGMSVVAEGVEDELALQILKDWGCDVAQGYYISKPLPSSQLMLWLEHSQYA
ncbi:EAL domain-containing protein [Alteromonas sp. ZYF713]|nr:EAL domain-containing protein [Alteromonas sp. ZYF713]